LGSWCSPVFYKIYELIVLFFSPLDKRLGRRRKKAAKKSKRDLLFGGSSGKIVKLIILIPYFTVGGASTMAKCECCGKGVTFGIKVSHSHRRSNRTWKPNVRRVKAVVEGSPKYIYACSRCLRAGKVTRAV
jgi:large subunit ribosomal protein L28